ncbi:MAG: dihydrodipicolinate synthase family protein [Acidobacteria bacterium]|nr:dihydrodipicolinate synthase family protein [Acidobacteriota bacterium]
MHFHGILPAVVTPVDQTEQFNPQPFRLLLERCYSAGVHGIYVCGQTGEGLQQSTEQRMRVTEAAMEFSPSGSQVIVHIGAFSTREAVALARHAAASGAAAVSALPPFGSYSFAEIKAYYQAIAEACSAPLLVYYFTPLSGAISHLDQLLDLCSVPNVAGLKFTDSDMYKLAELARSGATVFNGSDEMLVAGLLRGAHGGIGSIYNLIPDLFVDLYSLARAGEWAQAATVQDRINVLIRIILRYPVFGAVKTLLRSAGIDCGPCLRPRRDLSAAESAELIHLITQTEFAPRFAAGAVR